VFDFVRVSLPVPTFVSEPPVPPLLPPSWISPEKVVPMLFAPTASSLAPRNTAPVPRIDPVVRPGAL
jgi:hypothetical protein